MIQPGTRPAKHLHRVKKYAHFGAIQQTPDFDLGANLTLADQEADKAPYECTGYTLAHIIEAITKQRPSPDFSYAAARYVAGDGPEGVLGTSFHAAIEAAICVGALPATLANISAVVQGEQFISDWNNWKAILKQYALKDVQNGVRNVLGNGDACNSILSAAYQGGIPISIGSPWFNEWTHDINGGIVQMPVLNENYSAWHNYTIDGQKTINGVPYSIVYSHQGNRVGDNGKLYFSREVINAALSVDGAGALAIDPNAVRWISILGVLAGRFPALLPELPSLISA